MQYWHTRMQKKDSFLLDLDTWHSINNLIGEASLPISIIFPCLPPQTRLFRSLQKRGIIGVLVRL